MGSTPAEVSRSTARLKGVLPCLVIVVATLIRLHDLGLHSVWFDEALALEKAGAPTVAGVVAAPPHVEPPLYYLVLHGWMGPSTSEVRARLLSVILSGLVLLLAWQILLSLVEYRVALAVLVLFAFSPFQVLWSRQARPYALREALEFAGLMALLGAWAGRSSWALWAAFAACGSFTHYLSALTVPCHLAFLLLLGAGPRIFVRVSAWGLLALAPAGYMAWRSRAAIAGINAAVPQPAGAGEFTRGIVEQLGAGPYVPGALAVPGVLLYGGLGVAGIILALAVVLRRRGPRARRPDPAAVPAAVPAAAVLALGVLPFVLLWAASWAGLVYQPKVRYALGGHLFLLLACVNASSRIPWGRAVRYAAVLLMAGLQAASLGGYFSGSPPALDLPPCLKPLREAAAIVGERFRPGDVVLTTSVVVYLPLKHYLGTAMRQAYVSRDPAFTDGELAALGKPDSLAGALRGARRTWVVISPVHYLEPPDVPAPVAEYLSGWGRPAGEWKLRGVRVLLRERAP
jgi:hypothetical protein